MTGDRWRVAGLASPRSEWFFNLARWSTAAAVPIDFVKCVSSSELSTRFAAGETYSALLVGADVSTPNRAVIAEASDHGVVTIVIGNHLDQPWRDLGAVALLEEDFERDALISLLEEHAIPSGIEESTGLSKDHGLPDGWQGHFIAITGTGGTGASLLAMTLASRLASGASNRGLVLLADLALYADQAVLHDSRDVIPGLQEVVEACNDGWLGNDRLRPLLFEPAGRGYHLLLGLRRHRDWTALRRQPLEIALEGLTRTYRFVIADTDTDLEGEFDTGSSDVEDRNRLARTAVTRSDLVVIVGAGHMLGLHSLVRTMINFAESGVNADRLLPVINRTSRRSQTGITTSLSQLLKNTAARHAARPVFVPEHRGVESALHDGIDPPAALSRDLAAAITAQLATKGPA